MSNAHPIGLVVFDLDDVLCAYDFAHRLRLLARMTGLEATWIEKAIWSSGFDEQADQGRYTSQDYLDGFVARLGVPLSRAQWIKARTMAMTPDPEMLGIARAVSHKTAVAMLTNNGPLLQEALPGILPEINDIFGDNAYFSSQFGCSKPNPDVFLRLLTQIGKQPMETLFIDDQADYIDGAKTAGLRVHHFQGATALRVELTDLGLL